MPSAHEAFAVGYSLNLVGAYFESASLLAHLGASAPDHVREACNNHMRGLAQQRSTTRWHVRRIERAVDGVGLTPPAAPARPDDYPGWVQAISDPFYGALEDEAHKAAYLAGWYVGDWALLANLGLLTLMLLEADARFSGTLRQRDDLKERLAEADGEVRAALTNAPVSPQAEAQLTRILTILDRTPPLDDASQENLDLADDYQEALHELSSSVEKLEAALRRTA